MVTAPKEIETYYGVLDIDRSASQPEIKQAFRRLAKRYHPDTNRTEGPAAAKKLKKVIAAYRVLSNDRERARYDVLMQASPTFQEEARRSEAHTLKEYAQEMLGDLLAGRGRRALNLHDQLCARGDFALRNHLDVKDYLDCIFLLAEQCERANRFREAAALYEELYEKEKEPPRQRYFFDEVKARIKKLYSRKLPRDARSAAEEIGCYERILKFELDKSEKAFILKKIAEVHCRVGDEGRAKEIFSEALKLKPGLKGTATIRENLGMENA
ncbi:MAG: DnaJ domain-containing protein [Candidatus Brocadiae bacterium]|nr:DnaJ domain-containing protein [Candidatus Brocadiia bacterium]